MNKDMTHKTNCMFHCMLVLTEKFIKKYGREKYDRLMTLFEQKVARGMIADEFDVSRERVRQWKSRLFKFSPPS